MKKDDIDYVLVPSGLTVMVAYHFWLLYQVVNHPTKTVMGINSINRRIWVQAMMEDTIKNGVLAVQTLRNNIMASTLLASTAIMLSSVIAVLITNGRGTSSIQKDGLLYGDTSELGLSIKFFSILVCFLVSFLMNLQSIRYYSQASILINVPVKTNPTHLSLEYVGRNLNQGSHFWSLGLRSFYFSFPIFMWIFGPIPMFLCCIALVTMLYFLDITFDLRTTGGDEKDVEYGSMCIDKK